MDDDLAIRVSGVSKVYKLYEKPIDRLKESLNPFRKKYHKNFYALKDVNFELKKGEILGVIGKNGAGKSTLLKILTGVLSPGEGEVCVKGNVAPLLELGFGFNLNLSGIENIHFNGAVLGYSEKEMEEKLNEIIEFADIGDFINQPVRLYSSGMSSRLAFAVAINIDLDILIVDEVLAVGDMRFAQKCYRKIQEFREKGKTILIVTHNIGAVISYCSKAIWLEDGRIRSMGEPKSVCRDYTVYMNSGKEVCVEDAISSRLSSGADFHGEDFLLDDVSTCSSTGEGGVRIRKVALYSWDSREKLSVFKGGVKVALHVEYEVLEDIDRPIMGFTLKDSLGRHLFGVNTYLLGVKLKSLKKGDSFVGVFEFDFPVLSDGDYSFDVGVSEGTQEDHIVIHRVYDACLIKIVNKSEWGRMPFVIKCSGVNFRVLK